MKKTAVRALAVAAAALFATTATACSSSDSSAQKQDTTSHAQAAAEQGVKATPTGDSSPSASPSASLNAAATITATEVAGLGKIVTDGNGNTLYMFAKDTTPKSTCNGDCAKGWPPAIVTKKPKLAGTGLQSKLVGTTTRTDGKLQVMYNNHPLYYFLGDTKTGWTKGQGVEAFGAKWYVVDPAGNKVTAKPSPSPSVSVSVSASGGSASASVGY